MKIPNPRILNDPFSFMSITISLVLTLLVLSFKSFFFFIPSFSDTNFLIALLQVFSGIGWILLIVVPPIALVRIGAWNRKSSQIFLVSVLLWPTSTILIKVVSFITWQVWLVGYLSTYPIFLFMDVIAPLLYVLIWNYKRQLVDD